MLSITFLFVHGCKKDKTIPSDSELIQEAREWFNAQPNVSYSPNWDKASVTHFEGRNFVILPSNVSLSSGDKSIYSFLTINIFQNETQGNLIELFNVTGAEVESLKHEIISKYLVEDEKIQIPGDISLKILLFDVNHRFIKGNAFVNGDYAGRLNLIVPKNLKSQLLMKDVGSTKKETCVDYYYVLSDTKSAVVYSATYLYTICAGGRNGGGSGSGGGSGGSKGGAVSKQVDVDPNARQCLKDIKAALEALGMKNTGTGRD